MSFYAVAHGFVPGVYESWAEAKKNIDDFPQPVHKKFASKCEAEAYLKERRPVKEHDLPSDGAFETYYVVARGKETGIFDNFDTVKKHIDGYPQPLQKKFSNYEEAINYFNKFAKGVSESKADKSSTPKAETSKKSSEKKEKSVAYYAVAKGHETGVFSTWAECQQQTKDFRGAKFKKFDNEEDAILFSQGKTLKQIEEVNRKRPAAEDSTTPEKKKK